MNQVDKVKKICKEKGISIHKLEMDCGFANGYVSQLKKGVFPTDRAVTISKYLGVDMDFLFTDENIFFEKDAKSSVKDQMLRIFETLSPDDQKLVLELALKFSKDKR